jgi:hypothetical protein
LAAAVVVPLHEQRARTIAATNKIRDFMLLSAASTLVVRQVRASGWGQR